MSMDDLTGASGDLIDRLLAAVAASDQRDRRVFTVRLATGVVSLETRDGGVLGLEDMVEVNTLADDPEVLAHLRRRMVWLETTSGQSEDVVVRELRDRITAHCENLGLLDEDGEGRTIAQRWRARAATEISDGAIATWSAHRADAEKRR
jgi:hypothetical protein